MGSLYQRVNSEKQQRISQRSVLWLWAGYHRLASMPSFLKQEFKQCLSHTVIVRIIGDRTRRPLVLDKL